MLNQSQIRNFAIIAHIDHGKSTLADRLLEITGTVSKRDMTEQTLDSNPISRERGITIKLAPVTMHYFLNPNHYTLNLIDTPGHVDFSYEVERSLAACEGAILLVDATQGIQAQTLSNFHKAKKLGLTIIPVINKIDSPSALVEEVEKEIQELFFAEKIPTDIVTQKISAKTGQGVEDLLKTIIEKIPAPSGNPADGGTRALVFSSQFDEHRGVIAFIRVIDGTIKSREKIKFLATGAEIEALEVGHFTPKMLSSDILESGEVGYVATNLKNIENARSGDTITIVAEGAALPQALAGYKEPQPMVFVSFFPVDQNEFKDLEDGLNKLKLNDAALTFTRTESKALGRGFRVGFLGHLHAEVSQERLEDEFNLSVIATTPTVEFKKSADYGLPTSGIQGSTVVSSQSENDSFLEPWVEATIIVPQDYVGAVMTLCEDRRGNLGDMSYHGSHVTLSYELPLAEIITDFFDQLKSKTSGFGSLDYDFLEYRPFDSVNFSILINHQEVDALSQLVEKSKAQSLGTKLVERLKEAIPQQQIPIPIQAAINGTVIARADISAYRKDVTAKLYGGDVTRRKKLLEKQKKGKEKMKQIGQVTIPNDTFLKIFKT